LKTSITYKQILALALPIYGGLIANQSIIVADTFFLGKIDSVQQSAVGIAALYYMVFYIIGYGFTMGGQILIARRIGEGKPQEVGKLFWNIIHIAMIYAIAVFLFFRFFSYPVFSNILESQELAEKAAEYLSVRSFGFLGTQLAWCFCAYNIGRGNSVAVTIASVVNATVNIVLAWLLIFGKAGFPEMQLRGAAIASGIADVACACTYILYILINKDYKIHGIKKYVFLTKEHLNQLFKVSFWLVLQYSLSIIAWFYFFVWIENTGKVNIEISIIVRSIYSVFLMSPIALSSATNSMVSNIIGQGRENEVIPLIYKVIRLSFIYVLIVCPVLLLFPDALVSLFTNNESLIPYARQPLITVYIAMIFFSISAVFFQGVSGTGNTFTALIFEAICITVYMIYSYIATDKDHPFPLWIIWMSEVWYMFMFGLLSAIYMHSGRWKKLKI
jgi:putative MATE family efflux protein